MPIKNLLIREKTIFDGIFSKYILKFLFSLWFKIAGWKLCKVTPEGAGITIAAPHTSNWDFVYALGAAILQDVKIYFSIKDSMCRVPILGRWLMYLGAMPIDRSEAGSGQVDQIKQFIETQKGKRVFFLFTPEGTRGGVAKWNSGFYHVAQGSGLPIFLAKVDYLSKETGVFHIFKLTESKDDDIQAMQASYKSVYGKYPAKQFPPYQGRMPRIGDKEAAIIRALYAINSIKGVATKMEISAKAKMGEISNTMFDFLIEKGLVEQGFLERAETTYRLTLAGKGCYLHLYSKGNSFALPNG